MRVNCARFRRCAVGDLGLLCHFRLIGAKNFCADILDWLFWGARLVRGCFKNLFSLGVCNGQKSIRYACGNSEESIANTQLSLTCRTYDNRAGSFLLGLALFGLMVRGTRYGASVSIISLSCGMELSNDASSAPPRSGRSSHILYAPRWSRIITGDRQSSGGVRNPSRIARRSIAKNT